MMLELKTSQNLFWAVQGGMQQNSALILDKSWSAYTISLLNIHVALLSSSTTKPGFYVQAGQEVNGGVMLNAKAVERTTLLSHEQRSPYKEEKLC